MLMCCYWYCDLSGFCFCVATSEAVYQACVSMLLRVRDLTCLFSYVCTGTVVYHAYVPVLVRVQ